MTSPPALGVSRLEGLRLLRRSPIELLERAASLGDVTRIPLPGRAVYLANRPELAWEVLVTRARDVRKSPVLRAATRVLGQGLLTSEDPLHRRQREVVRPMFHHERIETYGERMVELAERAASRWSDGQELDLHAEMARLTLAIVASTVFDVDVDDVDATKVRRALHDVLEHFDRLFSPLLPIWERLPFPSTLRYRRGKDTFDEVVRGMIRARRTGTGGDDLLSLLIAAQRDGIMSEQQVRDEAVTLYLAGHETTSNALTWTWHLLTTAPGSERRLHAELDAVLEGGRPGPADLPDLSYTGAVLHESLRLRPPAWAIGREIVRSFELDGHVIAAGSVVIVSPWLLHRDPRSWGVDALRFRPGRWLEAGERPRHAFLPFGGGPRMCIGQGFATMEASLVLATIARGWRFEADERSDVGLQPVITLRPRGGLRVRAFRR